MPWFPGGAARLFVSALPALDAAAVEAARAHTTRLMLMRNDGKITMVGDACCIPDVFDQFWRCRMMQMFFLMKAVYVV